MSVGLGCPVTYEFPPGVLSREKREFLNPTTIWSFSFTVLTYGNKGREQTPYVLPGLEKESLGRTSEL